MTASSAVDTAHAFDFSPEAIARFWQAHPCGDHYVKEDDWRAFFTAYDAHKYANEPHIPVEIAKLGLKDQKVLEIGLGQGAEAAQIIRAGARYTGIDLTEESVKRVRLRCELFGLPYEQIEQMNAERIAFPDNTFDVVFSHGVIHHSPRIGTIVQEIHRVLKPGGRAVLMVYHRDSLNYRISIAVLRRAGIFLLFVPGMARIVSSLTGEPQDRLVRHRARLRAEGLSYLKLDSFIHHATDGPDNVYSAVFSRAEAGRLLARFSRVDTFARLINERHFPGMRQLLPASTRANLASRYGWHLWAIAVK